MTIDIENLFDGDLEEEIPSAADISLRDAIESLDEDILSNVRCLPCACFAVQLARY